jgi:putative ABC transport system substrate-binding protein
MRRREFIAFVLTMAAADYARAEEPPKKHRVAVVSPATPIALINETGGNPAYQALFQELRRLGYVEGSNLIVERYSGEGRIDHYAEIAREVVQHKPDLVFTVGALMAQRFQSATGTIPVIVVTADPVAYGFAAGLARPGGNITGIAADAGVELWSKRLGLLKEAFPMLSRVGFLASRETWGGPQGAALREAAQRLGVLLVDLGLEAMQEGEYRRVFVAMSQEPVEALVVSAEPEHFTNRGLIVELAEQARLPAIYPFREAIEVGGLMAYAIDLPDIFRRAANQIDQILKGTRPGDIPIYQPTKFQLIVNLKAASAIGVTIPSSLALRADEVLSDVETTVAMTATDATATFEAAGKAAKGFRSAGTS